jgi:hypothetical protein
MVSEMSANRGDLRQAVEMAMHAAAFVLLNRAVPLPGQGNRIHRMIVRRHFDSIALNEPNVVAVFPGF